MFIFMKKRYLKEINTMLGFMRTNKKFVVH